ncbi:hypothetical protein NHH03_16130, partial [Stieleria sp. TO1_6]|nr:hypothetical protein [Stieleria tagensis]
MAVLVLDAQAPVCLPQPSRPRTNQTVTSNVNPRKLRPDEFRWSPLERNNRGRDVRRPTKPATTQKRATAKDTKNTKDDVASQALVDTANVTDHGDRAVDPDFRIDCAEVSRASDGSRKPL